MTFDNHISENEIISFICGELDPQTRDRVQKHSRSCPPCSESFLVYQHIYDGLTALFRKQGKNLSPAQLHAFLLEEAEKEKIYFSRFHFPDFFPISAARSHLGIVKIFLGEINLLKLDEILQQQLPGKLVIHADKQFQECHRQLKAYFAGERNSFDRQIDKSLLKGEFQQTVLDELMQIEYGHYITYGELANRIRQPRASRAVGNALGRNPLPILIPCHRVLASNGQLGGFTGGIEIKKQLLRLEKIAHKSLNQQMSLF